MEPLTDAEIHRAIRALAVGAKLDRTLVHRALLMALALRPALAESAHLRATGQTAMAAITAYYEQEDALGATASNPRTKLLHFDRAHGVAKVQDLPEVQALRALLGPMAPPSGTTLTFHGADDEGPYQGSPLAPKPEMG